MAITHHHRFSGRAHHFFDLLAETVTLLLRGTMHGYGSSQRIWAVMLMTVLGIQTFKWLQN